MFTTEEHIKLIVDANWNDRDLMVHKLARELSNLRSALPIPAQLESVASQLEMNSLHMIDMPDGSMIDGPDMLRNTAQLVRIALTNEFESIREAIEESGRPMRKSASE
jgi:hypothetical protein